MQKTIVDALDANTKASWLKIKQELVEMKKKRGCLSELGVVIDRMLENFGDSYIKFNQVPPGLKETLDVILPLTLCQTETQLKTALGRSGFHDQLQTAIKEVESVKSDLHYVKGGLRIIAALVLLVVVAPIVFMSGAVIGITAGFGIPFLSAMFLIPAAVVPTFYTYQSSTELLKQGMNQIHRKQHESGNEGKLTRQFGLFKEKIEEISVQNNEGQIFNR